MICQQPSAVCSPPAGEGVYCSAPCLWQCKSLLWCVRIALQSFWGGTADLRLQACGLDGQWLVSLLGLQSHMWTLQLFTDPVN